MYTCIVNLIANPVSQAHCKSHPVSEVRSRTKFRRDRPAGLPLATPLLFEVLLWQAGIFKVAWVCLWSGWITYSGWLQLVEPAPFCTLLSSVSWLCAESALLSAANTVPNK